MGDSPQYSGLTLPRLEGLLLKALTSGSVPLRRLSRTLLLCTCIASLLFQGAAAVAMPCDSAPPSEQAESAHAHHPSNAESGNLKAVEAGHHGTDAADCCDGGYCSLGGCLTVLAVPQTGAMPEASLFDAPAAVGLYRLASRTLTTPYRPPAVA